MPSQEAPGKLEQIRELLNTWLIPNDTRLPTDRLPPGAPVALRALRDDLRAIVSREEGPELLNDWIERLGVTPAVDGGVRFRAARHPGDLLAIVLEAIAGGTWERLKACPDCKWVFYDNTRNAGKRWCLMTAGGPQGRSCGSIAKVKRHRSRALPSGT
jgi:predicted RNA-binding Zn ribbon-like protein